MEIVFNEKEIVVKDAFMVCSIFLAYFLRDSIPTLLMFFLLLLYFFFFCKLAHKFYRQIETEVFNL